MTEPKHTGGQPPGHVTLRLSPGHLDLVKLAVDQLVSQQPDDLAVRTLHAKLRRVLRRENRKGETHGE